MRSGCPLNYGLEIFGDKWTLLIIRDMIFFNKRHYNEFLSSEEGISTNILAERLTLLEREKFIRKEKDKDHKQKIIYSLTEKGIDLLPVVFEIGLWSDKYGGSLLPAEKKRFLEDVKMNREKAIQDLKEKLYSEHVGRS